MSDEQLVLEWVKIGFAIVAAAIAAWIAYRQSRTAERKLRYELYEKRFKLYEATITILKSVTECDEVITFFPKYSKFTDCFMEIDFLLHKEQKEFMGIVNAHIMNMLPDYIGIRAIYMMNPNGLSPEQQDHVLFKQEIATKRHHEIFMKMLVQAPQVFMPLLDFKKVL